MTRFHTRWTDTDVATLRTRHREGVKLAVIATELGRTRATVAQYCTKLGLHNGLSECRYCAAPLTHPAVGHKKLYCDALCRETYTSERESAARREAFGVRHCSHCGEQLVPFQAKYCSRVCGQAAWHRKVMSDPASKARRVQMLRANRAARQAVTT